MNFHFLNRNIIAVPVRRIVGIKPKILKGNLMLCVLNTKGCVCHVVAIKG